MYGLNEKAGAIMVKKVTSAKSVVRQRGQVTIKKELLEAAGIQIGDTLDFVLGEDNVIRVVPQVTIPRSEEFYWTKEWQEAEAEVDAEMETEAFNKKPIINQEDSQSYLRSLREK
jgi:bifunctional DNA-binding transcriptional regulator/antitoxin component of YhaV-PrlF toxin-antitoxin module